MTLQAPEMLICNYRLNFFRSDIIQIHMMPRFVHYLVEQNRYAELK